MIGTPQPDWFDLTHTSLLLHNFGNANVEYQQHVMLVSQDHFYSKTLCG